MICPKCNKEISQDSIFCNQCGIKITNEEERIEKEETFEILSDEVTINNTAQCVTLYHDNGKLYYQGGYLDGKRHGLGKLYNQEGKLVYDGEWKENEKSGFGRTFSLGGTQITYEGNWENNKKNGFGKSFSYDGKVTYAGNWIDGRRETPVYANRNNEVTYTYKNTNQNNSEFIPREHEKNSSCIKCPKCHSTQITANKKGFGVGKAVGGLLVAPVGILAGFIGSNKIIITCLKCGHSWKA